MLTRKQCPKCKGNIYSSVDYYGRYEQCLQCGYTSDIETEDGKVKLAIVKEKSATY
jgi:DNA-directed RNA polymerase subunit M/transcription elongation factor TFIIS